MHAKAGVADSRVAFLTSANLAEAALERNMGIGVLIRGGTLPASIDRLIDALLESGELQAVQNCDNKPPETAKTYGSVDCDKAHSAHSKP